MSRSGAAGRRWLREVCREKVGREKPYSPWPSQPRDGVKSRREVRKEMQPIFLNGRQRKGAGRPRRALDAREGRWTPEKGAGRRRYQDHLVVFPAAGRQGEIQFTLKQGSSHFLFLKRTQF